MNALEYLIDELMDDECVEGIVFGENGCVPSRCQESVMPLESAACFLVGMDLGGRSNFPACGAMLVWTDLRLLWTVEYDGVSRLDWAPRHPVNWVPRMGFC